MKLTHFDDNGSAIMVDVGEKDETERKAIDKAMEISGIMLLQKSGGKSGEYRGKSK